MLLVAVVDQVVATENLRKLGEDLARWGVPPPRQELAQYCENYGAQNRQVEEELLGQVADIQLP